MLIAKIACDPRNARQTPQTAALPRTTRADPTATPAERVNCFGRVLRPPRLPRGPSPAAGGARRSAQEGASRRRWLLLPGHETLHGVVGFRRRPRRRLVLVSSS